MSGWWFGEEAEVMPSCPNFGTIWNLPGGTQPNDDSPQTGWADVRSVNRTGFPLPTPPASKGRNVTVWANFLGSWCYYCSSLLLFDRPCYTPARYYPGIYSVVSHTFLQPRSNVQNTCVTCFSSRRIFLRRWCPSCCSIMCIRTASLSYFDQRLWFFELLTHLLQYMLL